MCKPILVFYFGPNQTLTLGLDWDQAEQQPSWGYFSKLYLTLVNLFYLAKQAFPSIASFP